MQSLTISDLAVTNLEDVSSESVYKACGWYDWFCNESSLRNRSKSFISLAKRLDSNWDEVKFFLKNNCPVYEATYDSIAFLDSDGNCVFWVEKRGGEWSVEDLRYHKTLFTSRKLVEVAKFINTLTPPK